MKNDLAEKVRMCNLCPFRQSLQYSCFPQPGEGNENAKFLIVNLRATINAHLCERPLETRNELILDKLLESSGIKKSDIYVTNLVKCCGPTTPKKQFMQNGGICKSNHFTSELYSMLIPTEDTKLEIIYFGVSTYELSTGIKIRLDNTIVNKYGVTYSFEELFLKGRVYFEHAINTLKAAKERYGNCESITC